MRKFLNAWLRRWAEASLRTELNGVQEKLYRALENRQKLIETIDAQTEAVRERKRKHSAERAFDGDVINALKARVPEEFFKNVIAHHKAKLNEAKTNER